MQQGSLLVSLPSGTRRLIHVQTALTHDTLSKRQPANGLYIRPIPCLLTRPISDAVIGELTVNLRRRNRVHVNCYCPTSGYLGAFLFIVSGPHINKRQIGTIHA